ncbi:MAG: efflux RND transporter periplasmic adaptor subunit [Verrucomicrobiota bacterium]|nr:efflux RND transporter periplasmic adaptor subunit [Verrucomicrobiota bacterium]
MFFKKGYSGKVLKWILIPSFFVFTIFAFTSCKPNKKVKKKKKINSIQVVSAKKMRLVELLETTGDVVAINAITLRATVEGPIGFCPWREGDRIEKTGQKLIEIDRPIYRQNVRVAKAELNVAKSILADLEFGPRPEEIAAAKELVLHFENCTKFAKIDFDRFKLLSTKDVVSKQDEERVEVNYIKCKTQLAGAKDKLTMLEEGTKKTEIAVAKASVEKADAKLGVVQAELDECLIKAPFPGIVTEVFVRVGDLTSLRSGPRPPLLKMMDPKSLVVRAGLPESCAAQIVKGAKVLIRLDAYPRKEFNGEIERIHPRIEWNSRTRIIEVRILDPVKLIPRMFARVSVQGRVVENAIVVPDSAIITTPRGDHVVFVVINGKAEKRKVKIGLEQDTNIEITDGVNAGDIVVIAGNLNLKNGASVKILETTNNRKEK